MTIRNQLQIEDESTNLKDMPLTKDVNEIFVDQVQEQQELAIAVFFEAISALVNGEPIVSRLMLRNLVNATIGFETLAVEIDKPSKSVHRMLSANGNPTMDNLTVIIGALKKHLNICDVEVKSVMAEYDEQPECLEQLQSA